MAFTNAPHLEERPGPASRRTHRPVVARALLAAGAALLVAACAAQDAPRYAVARRPLGMREMLHPGHWRGQVAMTAVDFTIEQVLPTAVTVSVPACNAV